MFCLITHKQNSIKKIHNVEELEELYRMYKDQKIFFLTLNIFLKLFGRFYILYNDFMVKRR